MTRMAARTLHEGVRATTCDAPSGAPLAWRRPFYMLCSAVMGRVSPDSVRVRVAWTEA